MTIVTIIQINKVTDSSRYIQHTLDPSIRANLILSKAINDSLFSLQNYVIFKEDKYLRQNAAYWSVIEKQNKQLTNYSTRWNKPEQVEKFESFQHHLSSYKTAQTELLTNVNSISQETLLTRLEQINNQNKTSTLAYLRLVSDPQIWEMERVFLLEEEQEEAMKSTTVSFLALGIIGSFLMVIVLKRAVILPLHKTMKIAEEISTGDYTLNKTFSGDTRLDNALRLMLEKLSEKQKENQLQQEMLEVYNDQLKLSNEELSQFSYRTSHDLKAPLVTVRRLATLITEDIKDGEYKEAQQNSEKIAIHVGKLENLVVDILNLAQAELKGESLEQIDINEVLAEVREKLNVVYMDNDIEIVTQFPTSTCLTTSRVRLSQILENLISNSIKYQDKNKGSAFIKVTYNQAKGRNIISVEDNGLGIPARYQDRVFEMFQRFHPHITCGSGLGLYIIKKHVVRGALGKLSHEE